MRLKLRIFPLLLIVAGTAAYWSLSVRQETGFDIVCRATLIHQERHNENPFTYKSNHTIVIRKDGTGYDQINGEASVRGHHHTLHRTVFFRYYHQGTNNYLTMKVTKVRTSGADDVPETAYKQFMSFINIGKERMVHLTYLLSGDVLISTDLGPFFICAI